MDTGKAKLSQEKLLSSIDQAIAALGDSPTASKIEAILDSISKVEDLVDRELKLTRLRKKTFLKEILLSERMQRRMAVEDEAPAYTDEQIAQAKELLKDLRLIDRFLGVCHQVYAGRDTALLLVKIATVSRHLKETLSVLLTGESAEGKNSLIQAVMKICDPSTFENFSHVSPQYLLYRTRSLDRKIIIFDELNGASQTAEILRTALSEDELSLGTVSKTALGGIGPMEIRKSTQGLVVISTWTGYQPDHELSTRLLICEIPHDDELTGEIFRVKGKAAANVSVQLSNSDRSNSTETPITTGESANWTTGQEIYKEFSIWQCADSLIEARPVIIPFAPAIAEAFPRNQSRYHRDFPKAIAIIQASALLHQFQRKQTPEGVIIATEADYDVLLRLSDVFDQSSLSIPEAVIGFLKLIQQNAPIDRKRLTVLSGLSDRTIRRYRNEAVKAGYLETDGRGVKETYKVIDIPALTRVLPPKERIFPVSNVRMSNSKDSVDTVREILDKGSVQSDELDSGQVDIRSYEDIIKELKEGETAKPVMKKVNWLGPYRED
jgi:hypothetical protein